MKLLKNIFSTSLFCLFVLSNFNLSVAEEKCLKCEELSVAQDVPMSDLEKISKRMVAEGYSSFESELSSACTRFTQIETAELNGLIRDLKDTPYPTDEYFQRSGCTPVKKPDGVKSPLLHLVTDTPCSKFEYVQTVHKYYFVKRKAPDLWAKAVDAKNTDGETLIDYIETLIRNKSYHTDESKVCAQEIVTFVCSTGGKYSKYANEKSCP